MSCGDDVCDRLKKDVNLVIPEKHELIVRVELSDRQKELYRLVLTRNFEELRKKSRASSSLYNMIMQLKKVRRGRRRDESLIVVVGSRRTILLLLLLLLGAQ